MLNRISARNFKAFNDCTAEFAPMTMLLGENGVGKSTLVQAILLSKQAVALSESTPTSLVLNGPFVHLGNGFDALRQNANEERIYIDLDIDGTRLSWEADYIAASDVLPMRCTNATGVNAVRNMKVRYLSAERVGPQLVSPYSQSQAAERNVDERGANAFGLLHHSADSTLAADDHRVPPDAKSRSIGALFNYYIENVSTGATIAVQDLSEIDCVSTTFSFSGQSELPMERIRPTNVGFGLSYVASVIISCLLAEAGDLLIIENPEAHLHTRGQRAITDLLIRTARSGVQVICETHSREMLYCARKQIIDKRIPDDSVSVLYVHADATGNRQAGSWFPLTTKIGDLGKIGESFLEYFGAPTDFIQSV